MAEHTFSLSDLISELTRSIVALQSESVRDFSDLSLRQVYYLDVIHRLENPTPTELARQLKVTKPTVSVAIEQLVQEGYLEKVKSDTDRRSIHVHLTERGRQMAEAHAAVHQHIAQALTRSLEHQEVSQLTSLLDKVVKALESR